VDRLRVTFELDGLVFLHVKKKEATAYLLKTEDHVPLLIVPERDFVSSEGVQPSNSGTALPPWDSKTAPHRYIKIDGKECVVGPPGDSKFDRTPEGKPSLGWPDLRWVPDLVDMTGAKKFTCTDKHMKDVAAKVTFRSAWVRGREPRDKKMRETKWTYYSKKSRKSKTQWLTDGLTVEVAVEGDQAGYGRLEFQGFGGSRVITVRLGKDAESRDRRVALSNMCPAKHTQARELGMEDVKRYFAFLGPGYEKVKPPVPERSPDATRCPPGAFLEI
jgi:hypothetical protein